MNRKVFLMGAAMFFGLWAVPIFAQQQQVDRLVENLNQMSLQEKVDTEELIREFYTVSEQGRNNDIMVLQLYLEVNLPDADVEKYIRTLRPDGSWPDIDYADRKRSRWSPSFHATRIQSLAKVYKTPASRFYHSGELSAVLHKAMNYWFEAKLVCPNWWQNEIGVPKLLGPAFLLLQEELSDDEKRAAEEVMSKSGFRMTGQNKVWLAGNVFIKALLNNDFGLARQARDTIVSEIFMTCREGLQPDYSFHQHGPQMQFGNYGLAFLGSISYWARVFSGTSMALDTAQLSVLRNFFIEGMQWPVWRGYLDVNASARQVFKGSQKGKAHSVAVAAVNMIPIDTAYERVYKRFIFRNQIKPGATNDLQGNKYYWRSDYGIQRGAEWYASVRMHSSRTVGFEMTNNENLKGTYSADGVLMLLVDGDEYENIYPVWDWKRLPGLTIADGGESVGPGRADQPSNRSDFVGGISNGKYGATGMVLDKDEITARKAYFMTDELVVCLGAGLTAKKDVPLFTTIDQRLLPSGDLLFSHDISEENLEWIHAGKTAYVMLEPARVDLSTQVQSGSWRSIAVFYDENQQMSAPVFKAVIHHAGNRDESYAYCVVPDVSKEFTRKFVGEIESRVQIRNTRDVQAVYFPDKGVLQAVFYKAGELHFETYGIAVRAKNPCIVMISNENNEINVCVSDPTQRLDKLSLNIRAGGVDYDDIPIDLPVAEGYRGSTVIYPLAGGNHPVTGRF